MPSASVPHRESPWGGRGNHGRGGGVLFNPTIGWLIVGVVVWLAAMAHQKTCETTVAGEPVNAMLRLCYSDLPITYQNQLASGHSPYFTADGGSAVDQPPVTGALMAFLRTLVAVVHPVREGVSAQQALDAANLFLVLASIVFGLCFLVLLRTQLVTSRLLRRSTAGRGWTLVALCLTVFTAGMISWELFGAALMTVSILAWHRGRWLVCGIAAGLAACASGFLLPLLPVYAVLALVRAVRQETSRPNPWAPLGLTAGVAAGIVVLVNLPVALLWPSGWTAWLRAQLLPDVGLGALWQQLLPEEGRSATVVARVLVLVAALLVTAVLLAVVLHGTGRRMSTRTASAPDLHPEQLLLVVLGITFLLAPTYAPQQALLLVPLVALCRPPHWVAVVAAAEAIYWAAVWAYLNGSLRFGTHGGETPYALAIVLRQSVQLATVLSVVVEAWPRPTVSAAAPAAPFAAGESGGR